MSDPKVVQVRNHQRPRSSLPRWLPVDLTECEDCGPGGVPDQPEDGDICPRGRPCRVYYRSRDELWFWFDILSQVGHLVCPDEAERLLREGALDPRTATATTTTAAPQGSEAASWHWQEGAGWTAPAAPETPPPYQFRLVGNVWHLSFEGESSTYSDSAGLNRIAALLRQPGKKVESLALVGTGDERLATVSESRQELQDAGAIAEMGREARRLATKISEGRDEGEEESVIEGWLQELEAIKDHIQKGRGRGGRLREMKSTSPAVKAHKTVRKSIQRTVEEIAKSMPQLAAHLSAKIEVDGTAHNYKGDTTISWEI